jgi:hypothetical protein
MNSEMCGRGWWETTWLASRGRPKYYSIVRNDEWSVSQYRRKHDTGHNQKPTTGYDSGKPDRNVLADGRSRLKCYLILSFPSSTQPLGQ